MYTFWVYWYTFLTAIALFPFDCGHTCTLKRKKIALAEGDVKVLAVKGLICNCDFIISCLFKICLQTSSQVAKLENTVETLRTVLTQKIQSEAQTVSAYVLLSK